MRKPVVTVIEIEGDRLSALRREAARRGTTAAQLARDLLDIAVDDNLFCAILDD